MSWQYAFVSWENESVQIFPMDVVDDNQLSNLQDGFPKVKIQRIDWGWTHLHIYGSFLSSRVGPEIARAVIDDLGKRGWVAMTIKGSPYDEGSMWLRRTMEDE